MQPETRRQASGSEEVFGWSEGCLVEGNELEGAVTMSFVRSTEAAAVAALGVLDGVECVDRILGRLLSFGSEAAETVFGSSFGLRFCCMFIGARGSFSRLRINVSFRMLFVAIGKRDAYIARMRKMYTRRS